MERVARFAFTRTSVTTRFVFLVILAVGALAHNTLPVKEKILEIQQEGEMMRDFVHINLSKTLVCDGILLLVVSTAAAALSGHVRRDHWKYGYCWDYIFDCCFSSTYKPFSKNLKIVSSQWEVHRCPNYSYFPERVLVYCHDLLGY